MVGFPVRSAATGRFGSWAVVALVVGHLALSFAAVHWDDARASRDIPWFALGYATLMATGLGGAGLVAASIGVFASSFVTLSFAGESVDRVLPLSLIAVIELLGGVAVLIGPRAARSARWATDWLRRVAAFGFLVPGLGALAAGMVVGDGDEGFLVAVLDRWGSVSAGSLMALMAVAVAEHRAGRELALRRVAETAFGVGMSLAILGFCRAFLPSLMPMCVLPLAVVGIRGSVAAAAAGSLVVAIGIALSRHWGFVSFGGVEVHAAVIQLCATALVAGLPVAFALLREEIDKERTRSRRNETRFRDAMEHSPFGMALLRLDGVCFSVNRALCDMLGCEPGDLVGKRPGDITVDDQGDFDVRLRGLLEGRYDVFTAERRYRRRDGSAVWAFVAVAIVREGPERKPAYLIAQLNDIEARRRVEQALELSESRWNFALESARQGVWDYDYRRRDTFYSPMWARMIGYEPGEISGEADAWLSLVHPYDLPTLLREEKRHLEGETEQFECEFRMRHKDGRWVWILDRGRVIARDEAGHPLRMIGTHTDITENRRLTEALQTEKERLRITLHSIGDGVICTDETGRISLMNPIAEGLTGWSEAHALGRLCSAVFRVAREGEEAGEGTGAVTRALETRERVSEDDGLVLVARDGARLDIEATASPVLKKNGELLGAVLVFQDVTRSRTLQKELAQLASHDALTGLRNRSAFEQTLSDYCAAAHLDGSRHSLCFVDLDRFKIINDTAGHAAGDALLREIGRLIRGEMRRSDIVARLGGDEFGILLVDCDMEEARVIAERLIERIGRVRFSWGGRVYEVGASVGIARVDAEIPLAADVMSRADVACYAAKAAGRNRVSLYHLSEGDARRHHHELHTAAGIRAALDTDRFEIYAQEILDLRPAGHLQSHAELLVRMRDDDGAILPPGAFIPAAERYGLMASIDRWMIHSVLHHLDEAILAVPRLSVSINLSANSLDDPGLLAFLAAELEDSRLPPHRLRFEITETSLINNITHAGKLVDELRAAGYAIMLDDFGAGLSSFAYLEQFPADYLKIDGSFVRKLTTNQVDRAIVESINDIGHKIGATTIAEFVEDEETLEQLRAIGVDMVQGYHVARPVPLAELLERLGGKPTVAARDAG